MLNKKTISFEIDSNFKFELTELIELIENFPTPQNYTSVTNALPTALETIRAMHRNPIPPKAQEFLDTFKEDKGLTNKAFIDGISQFTTFANLNPESRHREFGNRYIGIHYNTDLASIWNAEHSEKVKSFEFSNLTQPDWDHIDIEGYQACLYKGNKPAEALDSFVTGPSVIDCGMFTQLSIWFGIRYMLGNEDFNQLFGSTPFYITQLNYDQIPDPSKPYL